MANPPVQEFRFGLVKSLIWANHTKAGIRYSVTFARLFKDGQSWRESTRFGRDDLPLVAKLADMAHSWIFAAMAKSIDGQQAAASSTANSHAETE